MWVAPTRSEVNVLTLSIATLVANLVCNFGRHNLVHDIH